MNRRDFTLTALAATLGPYLDRESERLRDTEDFYCHYVAFEKWLDGILADAEDEPYCKAFDLGTLDKVALYAAITRWLDAQKGAKQ